MPESMVSSSIYPMSYILQVNKQSSLTHYELWESYCRDYSAGDVYNQEDSNKEDKHDSMSLIHGM
jgi:hypothetical protein